MSALRAARDRDAARRLPRFGVALVAGWALPAVALAQAWVPPAGVGTVNLVFQQIDNTGHLLADGSEVEGYDSESRGLLLELDYAFTDHFSVTVGVPYVEAKYTGPLPSFFGLELDECHCWNRGWQDFGATARYNLVDGGFALTPSISLGLPTQSYVNIGEAAIGRNLDELRLALDAGWRLDAISDRLSLSARYSYAFVEEVLGLSLDRSNASLALRFQASRRLSAGLTLARQWTHGGLASTEIDTDEEFALYDLILKDDNVHAGATVAWSFERLDLFAAWTEFVDGTDTHAGRALTVGLSWPFER